VLKTVYMKIRTTGDYANTDDMILYLMNLLRAAKKERYILLKIIDDINGLKK